MPKLSLPNPNLWEPQPRKRSPHKTCEIPKKRVKLAPMSLGASPPTPDTTLAGSAGFESPCSAPSGGISRRSKPVGEIPRCDPREIGVPIRDLGPLKQSTGFTALPGREWVNPLNKSGGPSKPHRSGHLFKAVPPCAYVLIPSMNRIPDPRGLPHRVRARSEPTNRRRRKRSPQPDNPTRCSHTPQIRTRTDHRPA